jgi:hypothetical protein
METIITANKKKGKHKKATLKKEPSKPSKNNQKSIPPKINAITRHYKTKLIKKIIIIITNES